MTDIPLNLPSGESRTEPLVLAAVGQYIDFALIGVDKAPAYVYGTQERAVTKDGKPKTKDVLTLMVLPRTDCVVTLPRELGQEDIEEVRAVRHT